MNGGSKNGLRVEQVRSVHLLIYNELIANSKISRLGKSGKLIFFSPRLWISLGSTLFNVIGWEKYKIL